ncbi:hypothetical protein HWV62_10613 [Athelia sp. TMB]|nr:hypothetical protein HWV62_16474 [Athelia sp. TMB]KAF7975004.1 hypothetical protein HWV62_10613 [Athelia sp. TMB]
MAGILATRFQPTVAGSYGGFVALIICLSLILVGILAFGAYHLFFRARTDLHTHQTLPNNSSSHINAQPASPRWLPSLPFRSKPPGDAENGLQVGGRPNIWRKGSQGGPDWMQGQADEGEWETEDGHSIAKQGIRLATRDSIAKSEYTTYSNTETGTYGGEETDEPEDVLRALPITSKHGHRPGSSSGHSHRTRPRSRSPQTAGLQRQIQMSSLDSMRSVTASPTSEGHSTDHSASLHSQAGLVGVAEERESGPVRQMSTQSGGSVSTRTSHTGTKFVEALDGEP